MGARQVRSPATPGGVQRPPPPPHCRASRIGISIGLELQGNPDSGRGPFKWRRRSEPSTRCKLTGGRRRRSIGCAERGTRSDRPRWGRGSRDSLTSGSRGNAERSTERGSGATARIATGAWKTWGGSAWRSGSGRAGSTEPGAGDGRGLAGHGRVRGGSTAGVEGRNGAPRFPPVPTRPPAKPGADRTEWARHPAPRPPLNPLAATSPGPSPAAVPGGPVRPHRYGLYLPAGGPTRPSPVTARPGGASAGARDAAPPPGGTAWAGAPRSRHRLPPGSPSRARAALPQHRAEPGVPFPSHDSAHLASPPAAPPSRSVRAPRAAPPRQASTPRLPGGLLPPGPGPLLSAGQHPALGRPAPPGGSPIAPAPGNLRFRSLRAHGAERGWDPGHSRGKAGTPRGLRAARGYRARERAGRGCTAPAPARRREAGGFIARRRNETRPRHDVTALRERPVRSQGQEPPSSPQRGSDGNGVRTTRGSPRLDAASGGHGDGERLEETGSAQGGPAAPPGLRCSLAGAEEPRPDPPRCHPGGAAGRHALAAAAGPLKARGPRAPAPRLRTARGAARGAPFVPRSPLTQAWCPRRDWQRALPLR
ncbi:translation initiation factor IF-2-like [Onychostruthus taczanowskii]|uniref:translation initiation factor IF-2-like n=1 Tax=Onychostruthus taczanowskii TaxID=356909 RepID=UPI001B804BCA|nr:translation initiation factor IF-2-like [Onychostruthus taczanowskii]